MEVLNKPAAAVEKPKPKPAGVYVAMIQGMPKQKKINVQGEEKNVLSFTCKPLMAREVDDQDALKSQPEVNTWPPQTKDFWIDDEQGEYALKQFLQHTLGIDPGPANKSKTLGQMCAEAPGKQLLTTYENYPYQSKEGQMEIGTRIKATAAI